MALPHEALWAHLRGDKHRRRLLIAWGTLAGLQILLRASDLAPIPLSTWFIELAGLTLIGVAHASLAPDTWRGSAAWPGALATFSIGLRITWESISLSFDTVETLVPFAGLGALLFLVLFVTLLNFLWRRIPAALLSVGGPLLIQLVLVGPKQTLAPFVPSPTPKSDSAPIVLITVDTLRADEAEKMQTVSRLKQRGAYWPRAMAASSWTWPSIVSILSGAGADEHGSGRGPDRLQRLLRWNEELPWLPTQLSKAGYVTAAFTTNPMVALMRLGPSFDVWAYGKAVRVPLVLTGFPNGTSEGGDAETLVDSAVEWLSDAPPNGWMLWVHLYEPHLPYRQATKTTAWDYNLLRGARIGDWYTTPDVQENVRAGYAEQVAHADWHISRLLDALEARDFFAKGTLVFSSDHGEELWDHGGFEHGHSHHGEVVDVPLLLVSPGVKPGERKTLAAHEDIANTVRAVVGIEHEGFDLREEIPNDRVARAYGNLYYRPMRSARVGNKRIIIDGDDVMAFDLDTDPKELHPRRVDKAAIADLLKSRDTTFAPGEEEALRALGYVH